MEFVEYNQAMEKENKSPLMINHQFKAKWGRQWVSLAAFEENLSSCNMTTERVVNQVQDLVAKIAGCRQS